MKPKTALPPTHPKNAAAVAANPAVQRAVPRLAKTDTRLGDART
jgi:hypothetical protein